MKKEYSNKDIIVLIVAIIIFLLTIKFSQAVITINTNPVNFDTSSGSQTSLRGISFFTNSTTNSSYVLTSINLDANCSQVKWCLRIRPTNATVAQANQSGFTALFNYTLNQSTEYWLMFNCDGDTSGHACFFSSNNTAPINDKSLRWNSSYYNGAERVSASLLWFGIKNITIDIQQVTAPQPAPNYIINNTQTPHDINASVMEININSSITYNNTIYNYLNDSYMELNKLLYTSMNGNCAIFEGQYGCTSGNIYTHQNMSKINNTYFWSHLDDYDIYPAYYPFRESYIRNTPQLSYSVYANNYVKFNIYNFSIQASQYFITLEFGAINKTGSSVAMAILYCNSSYTSGQPLTSPYCEVVDSFVPTTMFTHVHNYSNHQVVPVLINNITKTQTSYFIFLASGNQANGWNFSYVTNTSYNNISFNVGNGITWSNTTNIFNIHVHAYNTNDYMKYNTSYYINNTRTDSNFIIDYYNATPFAPSLPVFFNPECNQKIIIASGFNTTIFFNWSRITQINGDSFTHNISIRKGSTVKQITLISCVGSCDTQSSNYSSTLPYTSLSAGVWFPYSIVTDTVNGLRDEGSNFCGFELCESAWSKRLQPCTSGVKLIDYFDSNNCNDTMFLNFPADNNTYENCTSADTQALESISTNIEYLSAIILIFIVIFFIFKKRDRA